MEHLSNYHEDRPNQYKNSHKPHNKTGDLVLSLLESQTKHDQNFTMGESHCKANTSVRRKT